MSGSEIRPPLYVRVTRYTPVRDQVTWSLFLSTDQQEAAAAHGAEPSGGGNQQSHNLKEQEFWLLKMRPSVGELENSLCNRQRHNSQKRPVSRQSGYVCTEFSKHGASANHRTGFLNLKNEMMPAD